MTSIDLLAVLMFPQPRIPFYAARTHCWIMLRWMSPSNPSSVFEPQPVSHCQGHFIPRYRILFLNIISLLNIRRFLLALSSSFSRSLGSPPSAPFPLSSLPNLCGGGGGGDRRGEEERGFSFWTCWGMSC